MNKNLIIQIFWIIIVGVIIWFAYDIYLTRNVNQEPQITIPQRNTNIEKKCMEIAIEKANQPDLEAIAESGNPYLTKKDIPGMRENIKQVQFKECMDIWGD